MCAAWAASSMAVGCNGSVNGRTHAPRFSSMHRGCIQLPGSTTAALANEWNSLPSMHRGCIQLSMSTYCSSFQRVELTASAHQKERAHHQNPSRVWKPMALLNCLAILRGTASPSLPSSQALRDLEYTKLGICLAGLCGELREGSKHRTDRGELREYASKRMNHATPSCQDTARAHQSVPCVSCQTNCGRVAAVNVHTTWPAMLSEWYRWATSW